MERTLVLLKPDAVQRGLAGAIIARLEARGLKIVALKLMQMSEALAHRHYEAHVGKPFFPGLVQFITSGPLVAIVLEGKNAVAVVRTTMGATDPAKSSPGTIRGDLAIDMGRNLIHGSDSPEAAQREIALFFRESEIVDYRRDTDPWITES
ncbi:MAG: nucleoside-diphosphate kinase [Chloroflexota bacterium]